MKRLLLMILVCAVAGPARATPAWDHARPRLMDMARHGQALAAVEFASRVGGKDAWDARFVAGFITLVYLQKPDLAARLFAETAMLGTDIYGKSTAGFWLGRALAAAGRPEDAVKAWQATAVWSQSFYGQVAAARLGVKPVITTDPRASFGQIDVVQALATPQGRRITAAQTAGDIAGRNAALRMLASGTVKDQSIACSVANYIGAFDIAVDIARTASARGSTLMECGWPQIAYAWHDKRAPRELVLAVAREESKFRQDAASGAGANGSMQVLDGTARDVGRKAGVPVDIGMVHSDANYNVAVGSYYLASMLARYSSHPILALAAYNAGPGRVDQWLTAYGDPRTGAVDVVDWVEMIPITETRTYVKRVFSSFLVYLARSQSQLNTKPNN